MIDHLGENCDEPLSDRRVGSADTEKSSSGAFAGMFVVIILLSAIIMLFMYYRKRVAALKTVIAHVQYGADPLSLDQGEFVELLKIFYFMKTKMLLFLYSNNQSMSLINCTSYITITYSIT